MPLHPLKWSELPASERRELADDLRQIEVERFSDEILSDLEYFDNAIGEAGSDGTDDFNDTIKFLFLIAQNKDDPDLMMRDAKQIRSILLDVVRWYAEKKTPPVPCFFYPQAS